MLKIPQQGLPLLAHRIPGTLSLVILRMDTLATLLATTTSLQAEIPDRLHRRIIQEWVVHQDKDIPHHIHQHNVLQDMKDMEVPQVPLGITTTQEAQEAQEAQEVQEVQEVQEAQADPLQHGEDNMTKTLVHQQLAMTCTTEDGAEADIHLDLDIHKEVHQQHLQELLHHHHQTILQPLNLLINIRKVEWALETGHNLGAPPAQVHRDPQVVCSHKVRG